MYKTLIITIIWLIEINKKANFNKIFNKRKNKFLKFNNIKYSIINFSIKKLWNKDKEKDKKKFNMNNMYYNHCNKEIDIIDLIYQFLN